MLELNESTKVPTSASSSRAFVDKALNAKSKLVPSLADVSK